MIGVNLKENIEVWLKTKTNNSFGAIGETESKIADVKAGVKVDIGREAGKEDVILNQTEVTFYIRNYPEMTYDHYIIWKSDKYRILAIQPMLDRSGQTIKAVRNG
jgi:head-tail adaptor